MIAKLTGILDSIYEGYIILDVNGVGYRVFCSARTIGKLPQKGEAVSLMIETQVREDHIHLIGFIDATEQQTFGYLSTVQGVGVKVALAILSALSPNDIQMAVMTGDGKAFTKASGVGPKLGIRIVTELKGKMGNLGVNEDMVVLDGGAKNAPVMSEAVSALVNLGYSRTEAGMTVATILRQNPEAPLGEVIRLSLKEIGKGNM
ncbi:MAG: Holliday junction branch migration protein RuvA [Pseudomonadota bacterium]|nr:Holliday junction branch migration protein RuvA [Pseudomonadota bacterium]